MVKQSDIFLRYSPNHNERSGDMVSMLVLHYTGMRSGIEALEWLCNADSKVSSHYLVEENGDIFQLVEEDRRAWHAGVSHWAGQDNINDISIGVEIVNPGHEHGYRTFPEVQIQAVIALSRDIVQRYDIVPSQVVGHSDIAPLRKEDPGELFPWNKLAEVGVGLWHSLPDEDDTLLLPATQETYDKLHRFGYWVTDEESQRQAVIRAFQRHFRASSITGVWDEACERRLDKLLQMR